MKTEPNEPASPTTWYDFQPDTGLQVVRDQMIGLTKRELFSAMFMQGLTSNCGYSGLWIEAAKIAGLGSAEATQAKTAVLLADALIAALNEPQQPNSRNMTEPIKETINATHTFTPEEFQKLGADIGRAYNKKAEIEKEKKAFASQYKAKGDQIDADISVLSAKLNSGQELRPVSAFVTFDVTRKTKIFSDENGALYHEEPMLPSDWELPLFKEENEIGDPSASSTGLGIYSEHFSASMDLLPAGFYIVTGGRSQDGDIALNVERTAWVNVASPGANWDEYHGLARRIGTEALTDPTPDPESPVGETNLGDKLDAAAVEWPAAKLHFPTGLVPHPTKNGSSFVREFRVAAFNAGWSTVQEQAMVAILRKCDSVKAMQETLAPHIETGEAE